MGRPNRIDLAGYTYHIINRSVGRRRLFHRPCDFLAFERVLAQAVQRSDGQIQLLAYCIMANHWHLVLQPTTDGALAPFMKWMTLTHTQRYRVAHGNVGEGPVYQGRYKSFVIQGENHLLTVCRYVERNAARASRVQRAEDWRWSSLWRWRHPQSVTKSKDNVQDLELAPWPITNAKAVASDGSGRPRNWLRTVNTPQSNTELEALRLASKRCQPFGAGEWVKKMVAKHSLESTVRKPGRPKSETQAPLA